MDRGNMWHCTLVSSTPSRSIGLFYGCALVWFWVPLGAPVTISLIYFYFIMIVVTIIGIFLPIHYFSNYTLGILYLSSAGSANAQLPGCFRSWTFSLNIGLNMSPMDAFMSCLDSILGYFIGSSRLCNWLSLRRLVPWINHLPPVCWSIFWKSSLKWYYVCKFIKKTFFLFHILMPYNIVLYFRLPYFHVSNSALFYLLSFL